MTDTTSFEPLTAWTLEQAARILGAQIDPRWAGRPFGPLSTDSRVIGPGQFFLALRGEKFDGHRFCEAAALRGAAGLIVDRAFEPPPALSNGRSDLPLLRVADTLHAYGELAAARRRQWGGPVLAISGSAARPPRAASSPRPCAVIAGCWNRSRITTT